MGRLSWFRFRSTLGRRWAGSSLWLSWSACWEVSCSSGIRRGVSPADGLADMHRIAAAGDHTLAAVAGGRGVGDVVAVQTVERPAEIVNYRDLGTTPAVLDGGLALGATVALVLTLAASVRRRRRELALLKTLASRAGSSGRRWPGRRRWPHPQASWSGCRSA